MRLLSQTPYRSGLCLYVVLLCLIGLVSRMTAAESNRQGDDEILARLRSAGVQSEKNSVLNDGGEGAIHYVHVKFRRESWDASSRLVASLRRVGQNVSLDFYGIELDDDDLRQIRDWPNVIAVSFKACRIPDDRLRHVATLPKLRELYLAGGSLTNASLAHFCGHRELRGICLEGQVFSDEAVAHIKRIGGLKNIILFAHGFTAKGVEELRNAFPEASISVSNPSFDLGTGATEKRSSD